MYIIGLWNNREMLRSVPRRNAMEQGPTIALLSRDQSLKVVKVGGVMTRGMAASNSLR